MKAIMKRLAYLFLGLVFAFQSALGANVAAADSAYKAEKYPEAVSLYEAVGNEKGYSSELYYDLGNAYARSGDYGNAMVSYLRSLRLDPSNSQARHNIQYIQTKVADTNKAELKGKKVSLDMESSSFFSSLKKFIVADHRSDTWAIWAAASFVCFILCLAIYIFTRRVVLRKIGFFGGFLMICVSVISLVFAFMAGSYVSTEGVIVTAKVKLKNEPSLSAKESPVALTRGTVLSVLDTFPADSENPEWYKVRLNSDFVGWIPSADFKAVNM